MKRVMILGALISQVAPLSSSRADIGFVTGNKLYEYCRTQKGDAGYYQDNAFCIAYVLGVSDQLDATRIVANKPQCIPAGSTGLQLQDIVVKFMKDRPELRGYAGGLVVTMALAQAFSCN